MPYLLGGLVEGHRGIDQLEAVLHLQHELLPVGGHALCTVPDQVHVVVVGLKQRLRLLLHLQCALVRLLQGVVLGTWTWGHGHGHGVMDMDMDMGKRGTLRQKCLPLHRDVSCA